MKEKAGMPINQEEISHYLKDIRKIKVMTPDRERQLAERMLSDDITEGEIKKIQKELLALKQQLEVLLRMKTTSL